MREMTATELREMAADIDNELAQLARLEQEIAEVEAEILKHPPYAKFFTENLAFKLHNFYTGCGPWQMPWKGKDRRVKRMCVAIGQQIPAVAAVGIEFIVNAGFFLFHGQTTPVRKFCLWLLNHESFDTFFLFGKLLYVLKLSTNFLYYTGFPCLTL